MFQKDLIVKHKPVAGQIGLFDTEYDTPITKDIQPDAAFKSNTTILSDIDVSLLTRGSEMERKSAVPRLTKKGDMWLIGKHRLYCENSAILANLDTLLDGNRV